MKETLIVNFFGGPGCGKSTMMALLFSELKWMEINCEMASEYAKELVWSDRHKTIKNQIYIFGKQYNKIFNLKNQVDVIITDSPLLLTPIYDSEKNEYLKQLAISEHRKTFSYNVFLIRQKKFNPKGRIHSEEESRKIDEIIKNFLIENNIEFDIFEGKKETIPLLVDKIQLKLGLKKSNQ